MTAKPHQRLDVLLKFGAKVGNVFQAGTRNPVVQVLYDYIAVGIMDLFGTGAFHDTEIEFTAPSGCPLITLSRHRFACSIVLACWTRLLQQNIKLWALVSPTSPFC